MASPPPSSTTKASDESASMKGASLSLWNQSLTERAAVIPPSSSQRPDPAAAAAAEDGRERLHWLQETAEVHQGDYPDESDQGVFRLPQKDNAKAAKGSIPLSSPGFHQPNKPGVSSRYGQMLRENREEASSRYLELAKDASLASSTRSAIDAQYITAYRHPDLSRRYTLPTKENNDDEKSSLSPSYTELPRKHSRAEAKTPTVGDQSNFGYNGRTTYLNEQNIMLLRNTTKNWETQQTSFPSYLEPTKESHMLSPITNDEISSIKASAAPTTDFQVLADDANTSPGDRLLLSPCRSLSKEKTYSQSYLELDAKDSRVSSTKGPVDSQTMQETNLDKAFHNFQELANGSMAWMKASNSLIVADANRHNNKDLGTYRFPNKDEKSFSSYLELPRKIPPPGSRAKFGYDNQPLSEGNPGATMSFCGAFRAGTQVARAAAGV